MGKAEVKWPFEHNGGNRFHVDTPGGRIEYTFNESLTGIQESRFSTEAGRAFGITDDMRATALGIARDWLREYRKK